MRGDLRGARAVGQAILLVLTTLAITATLLALIVAASGHEPAAALRAMISGSMGSLQVFTSSTLVRAIPLALAGLAVALAFRGGLLNIGAEGQLLAGAAAAAAIALGVGDALHGAGVVVALLGGAFAGAAWAFIAALLRHRFGVLEVISTIMLNFVALHVVSFLVRGPLQEPLRIYPQTASFAEGMRLPLLPGPTRLHWGVAIAIASAAVVWWVLRSTAAGFRVRAMGANPEAARVAGGIDVGRTAFRVFLASGALAGLAGAVETTGVTYALYENLSPGYGYSAIAVALLARLHPGLVLVSATLFGALQAGAAAMQRDAGVPSVVVTVVEAGLILLVLVADRVQAGALSVRLVMRARAEPRIS